MGAWGCTGYYIESPSNENWELEFTVYRLLITPAPAGDVLGGDGGSPLSRAGLTSATCQRLCIAQKGKCHQKQLFLSQK